MARPKKYNEEIFKKVLLKIASTPKGLKRICEENEDFPCRDTVYEWMAQDEKLSDMYVRAKKVQALILSDELIDIADEADRDTIIDEKGKEKADHEWIARSRLRIDTRKFLLMKLLPRIFGEKLELIAEIAENKNATLTTEQRLAKISKIIESSGSGRAADES